MEIPRGLAQFRADSCSQGERETGQQSGHGGHHDGAKPEQTGLVNCVRRVLAIFALRLEGEVNHHDSVFLNDADQQDDAYERHDAQFLATDQQGKNRRPLRPKAGWKES